MWNPFQRGHRTEPVFLPAPGRMIDLTDVPDPVFAGRSMGDGFAVEPTEGVFRSPVDGELILVADTGHAFGVRTPGGAELLVHIGIDTVLLKGAGFRVLRTVGERVRAGDPVVECDLDDVRAAVPSLATPVIVTNGSAFALTVTDPAAGDTTAPVATVRRA